VLAVGLQRQRPVPPAHPQQCHRGRRIDQAGQHRDTQADPDVFEFPRVHEAVHRTGDDDGGRGGDHHALDDRRDVFDLEVAEVVPRIGRTGGDPQGDEGDRRGLRTPGHCPSGS